MLTETLGDKKIHFVTMKKIPIFFGPIDLLAEKKCDKKFCIRETLKLSTNADRSINTKSKLFLGIVWADERNYRDTERGGVTCHAKALKFCMKLSR